MGKVLIDADILLYKFCTTVDTLDMGDGVAVVSTTVQNLGRDLDKFIRDSIKKPTGCSDAILMLSKGRSFREELYPDYKKKRHSKPKPPLINELKQYMRDNYSVTEVDGLEGDDLLGIYSNNETTIATLDKDMLQIPGRHYNWKSEVTRVVGWMEGMVSFYSQILTGDSCDEYGGAKGIGKAKSKHIISDAVAHWLKTSGANPEKLEESLWEEVVKTYRDEPIALTMARLAYILRHGDYSNESGVKLWIPPKKRLRLS